MGALKKGTLVTIARVVLEWAIDKPLDYLVPHEFAGLVFPGTLVEVPVRQKSCRAIVISLLETSEHSSLQPIKALLSSEVVLTKELLLLAHWMARYYSSSLSRVLKLMIPSSVKRQVTLKKQLWVKRALPKEALIELCEAMREQCAEQSAVLDCMAKRPKGLFLSELLEQAKVSRSPVDTLCKKGALLMQPVHLDFDGIEGQEYFYTPPKQLNEEQKSAFDRVVSSWGQFAVHLLYGITGSGKTEVYLQLIDRALQRGESVIVLVPEIALTTQMIERFRSRFPQTVGVIHCQVSDGERAHVWKQAAEGELSILIGARSALFAPMRHLGLIVVDEEHESSYKQTHEMPCYHARDVAVMRGFFHKIPVLLGSATPSLESFHNAKRNKYQLSVLSKRPSQATLAAVQLVDMKEEFAKTGGFTLFSRPLLRAIEERLNLGEQSILFLNRRGYHTNVLCGGCGYVRGCPHCDIKLTLHMRAKVLLCHLCHYQLPMPLEACPQCHSEQNWIYKGSGTEQVERALHAIFPQVRTLRLDADTTRHKGSHEKLLREFRTGKADLLIGTQMVTKGLHFPSVTLVGVLNCDAGLNIPDFRAGESVFQLITQVSGRAGRGALPGEVILQSLFTENRTLQFAKEQDYAAFFAEELQSREQFGYPPFSHCIKIVLSGDCERDAHFWAQRVHQFLHTVCHKECHLHPVSPGYPAKVKDRYFFQLLLRCKRVLPLQDHLQELQKHLKWPKEIHCLIDVDPLSTL